VTGWLVYNKENPLPDPKVIDEFNHYDDYTLVPHDKEPLLLNPDQTVTLDVISMYFVTLPGRSYHLSRKTANVYQSGQLR
jgi:hypothetical protein